MSSSPNYVVPPKSWEDIDDIAWSFRCLLGAEKPRINIIGAMEGALQIMYPDFSLEVVDEMEMSADGETCPNGKWIRLRNDVYIGACKGVGRDRFTAAHELGHWVMHTNLPFMRLCKPSDNIPHYSLSEPQANQFAASILMPKLFMHSNITVEEMVDKFAVSSEAAFHRRNYLKKKGYI